MSFSNSESEHLSAAPESDLAAYKSLCAPALISLVLGIAAPVAWIGPVFWIVPALGIALAFVALRSIARNPANLAGGKMAVVGLVLSLLFGSAALSQSLSRAWWLRGEARQVAELWCDQLANDRPALAHRWMVAPGERHLDDTTLWSYYRNTVDARESLESFVAEPAVHFLLAHGKQVQVRFWRAESLSPAHDGSDAVRLFYAVTRDRDGSKETFFLRFVLSHELGIPDLSAWSIRQVSGQVNPFEDEI